MSITFGKLAYLVWCPELGQGPEVSKRVWVADAEEAAERWADWYDAHSADYPIVSGQDVTVCVRREGQDRVSRVRVSGQESREYTGCALEESLNPTEEEAE